MAKKSSKESNESGIGFAFGPQNYRLLLIGLVVIAIGFILMAGGKSDDPNVFNPEIFSWRRITLAPLVVLAGFVIEGIAIMKKPKVNK
ncbi:MAG: DUF3098 domain-containing protein [Bacteroidota bacterium]|nr:DUF3098 domain-containing protein [Bacteroidota bacterium]